MGLLTGGRLLQMLDYYFFLKTAVERQKERLGPTLDGTVLIHRKEVDGQNASRGRSHPLSH